MPTFSRKILIERLAYDVYTFISDYQNDWKWRTRHLEVQNLNHESEVAFVSSHTLFPLFSLKKPGRCSILSQVPYQCLISKIELGKISLIDERQVKSLPGNTTEFEYTLQINLSGISKLFQPMLFKDLFRDFHRDLDWLKELLEVLKTQPSHHSSIPHLN